MKQNQPVFIHSLFRAGSTYIFKLFRESPAGYTAYQEPLHEVLIFAAKEPEKLLDHHHETSKRMRHPSLDKPYFYEFYVLADKIGPLFRKEFSFDQFFVSDTDDISDLKAYIAALVAGSEKRAVFQCCRSTGRAKRCRIECGGTHIFLWRNPWDQWWSYMLGFDPYNLLILNAKKTPPYLQQIKAELNIPELHTPDIVEEYLHYQKYMLTSEQSYTLFYALWCHAMLEAMPACDMSINIDRLSASQEYKDETLACLNKWDIDGLDFSDCYSPRGIYEKPDVEFFIEIEQKVHALLLDSGYTQTQIDEMLRIRAEYYPPMIDPAEIQHSAQRDATRSRELVRKYETSLHDVSRHNLELVNIWAEKEYFRQEKEKVWTEKEYFRQEQEKAWVQKEYFRQEQEKAWVQKESFRQELESTRAELESTRAELESTRAELEFTQAEMEYTRSEMLEAEAKLSDTKNQLASVSAEKQNLKARLDAMWLERERFRLQVEQIYASRSYRIAAPLRWATDALRALRANLRNARTKVSPLVTKTKIQIRRLANWLKTTKFGGFLLGIVRKRFPGLWKKIAKRLETDSRIELGYVLTGHESVSAPDEEYFVSIFNKGIKTE